LAGSLKTMNSISRAVPEVALQAIRKLITSTVSARAMRCRRNATWRCSWGSVGRRCARRCHRSVRLGVVSMQPGKGVFVQAIDETPAFAWPFAAQASPLDIFQLRYALEGFAAGLAAVTLTTDELDAWRTTSRRCARN
jgi:GntR family transcriptional repressor for pyruvate dehydrogenase complex